MSGFPPGRRRKDKTMTHIEKIARFIDENGSITDRQADRRLGVGRLASRIFDMKQAGFNIKTETIKVRNRDGSFSHVARYSWGNKA